MMTCQNCKEVIEPGAAFCGNCGQAVHSVTGSPTDAAITDIAAVPTPLLAAPILQTQSSVPANVQFLNKPYEALQESVPGYALATPNQHVGENKALLAMLFGITGIIGGLFVALIGLALGISGIVMGTLSRSSTKRGLSTAGLAMSSLAILASLGVWTYAIRHDPALQKGTAQTTAHNINAPAVVASDLSTPCYSTGFVDKLNVSNSSGSCDMSAFNGSTLNNSTNAYKVYADQSPVANSQNFTSLIKPALEKDVKNTLPGFTIDNEQVAKFAGSPAYIVNTSDNSQGIALVEAAVLRHVNNGDNIFILVHAVSGRTTDLNTLEAQWQWK